MSVMSGRAIEIKAALNPPAAFPDPATCRVKPAGFGSYMDCMNGWGWRCPFSLQFGDSYLCRHPLKEKLLAATEAKGEIVQEWFE
jgi:hypothetical protein